jgi:transcription termination/antitermination protein NusG
MQRGLAVAAIHRSGEALARRLLFLTFHSLAVVHAADTEPLKDGPCWRRDTGKSCDCEREFSGGKAMPLLDREPMVFPDHLLQSQFETVKEAGNWWLLYTKPRMEKAVSRSLLARETGFFLPLYQRSWRKSGRIFKSYLPLFPGYLFLFGDEQGRLAALETRHIVQMQRVADQAQLHHELAAVYRLIASNAPLLPEERLQPGTAVEVVAGPFQGLHGKFIRRGAEKRLVVEVQMLQCGVSVEVESWMIRSQAGGEIPDPTSGA